MLKKHALITGVNGFVGKQLAKHLLEQGRDVYGIDIQQNSSISGIEYKCGNVCDHVLVEQIFKKSMPAEIYHLAAVSSLAQFNANPYNSFLINILGAVSLFEAMKNVCPEAVILAVGSSLEYANPVSHGVSEADTLNPSSYYGASKYVAEIIGRFYVHNHNLDVRYARSFNHTGPGQAPNFVCSDWARQVAFIQLKMAPAQVSIGAIDTVIDFTDVRDIVRAYHLIVEKGKKGEVYNVCSGKGSNLKYILDYLISKSTVPVSVNVQPDKLAKHGKRSDIIGNNQKIKQDTGWSPSISIDKTLDDLLGWWMKELSGNH